MQNSRPFEIQHPVAGFGIRRALVAATLCTAAILGAQQGSELTAENSELTAAELGDVGVGSEYFTQAMSPNSKCPDVGITFSVQTRVGVLVVRGMRNICSGVELVRQVDFKDATADRRARARFVVNYVDGKRMRVTPPLIELGNTLPPKRYSSSYPSLPGKDVRVGLLIKGDCNSLGQNCLTTGWKNFGFPNTSATVSQTVQRKRISI
ncbi:MAG: hypothetical protein JNK33_03010 [Candidatus Doudnabacteria bacterium]|nr:hypothetical protein [Candidatus Doudnabacteria bacterium]